MALGDPRLHDQVEQAHAVERLFPEVRNVFLLAGTTGIISGIFSNFPGGFIPNVIDKFITAFIIYAIIISLKKSCR